MCADLPQKAISLLSAKDLVFISTLMSDGSPQLTPVWANYSDGHILVNTAEGRVKHKNVLKDPRVAISVVSKQNPLDMVSIRGKVAEIIPDYDYSHADILAKQYLDLPKYPFKRPDEKRIIFKILPLHVFVLPEIPMNTD